jgi:hypothetical protein
MLKMQKAFSCCKGSKHAHTKPLPLVFVRQKNQNFFNYNSGIAYIPMPKNALI